MARIFITGSADGLGKLAATELIRQGHRVVLHARNASRGDDAMKNNPGAETVFTADLSNISETIELAHAVNNSGPFDAIIHNAGVYRAPAESILAVNTLAPYILTSLVDLPARSIYLSSGMHLHGRLRPIASLSDQTVSYADSKFHVLLLCKAVARAAPAVFANAVNPGWVPTRMGGRGAPDDLKKGYETQVWLAVSEDQQANVSGRYFFHQKQSESHPLADDRALQEQLLNECAALTGIVFPTTVTIP